MPTPEISAYAARYDSAKMDPVLLVDLERAQEQYLVRYGDGGEADDRAN